MMCIKDVYENFVVVLDVYYMRQHILRTIAFGLMMDIGHKI